MKSIAQFIYLSSAVDFCEAYHHDNLHIAPGLDGRYHVYDMGGA
tara:strand:- start:289 stop:420 length:132 start_codon:yes stop_codon:yes gene_type:complete